MLKKLIEICDIEKGKQIDTKMLDKNSPYKYINGGIKESGYFSEYNTQGKTVIVSEGGASCGYVNYIEEPFWCGCHCYRLTNAKVNEKYLYYVLKGNQDKIMKLRTGAAMPNIKKSSFANMILNITEEKSEQNTIVNDLDCINNLINCKQRELFSLDELIKSRFIEMFGYVTEKIYVKDVANVLGGFSFKSKDITTEGVRLLQIANVALIDITWETINYLPHDYLSRYTNFSLCEDDIIMALTRPIIQSLDNVKTCIIRNRDLPALLNQRVARIKANKVNFLFLFYCFMTEEFTQYVKDNCSGSSQPNMSTKAIENFLIPNVSIRLQNEFALFVELIDKSKFISYSRYFLCEILTLFSSTIAYSRVVSIF